jgi:uncharacterized membrane protein
MILRNGDGRLWEIDFLRGIALIVMIVFHFLYDLQHFSIIKWRLYSGIIPYLASIVPTVFVLFAGVSLTLNYSKLKNKFSEKQIKIKFIKRGIFIFSLGLIITFVSYIFLPEIFVVFGILHCISISVIFSTPFIKTTYLNIVFGFSLVVAGLYLKTLTFGFNWLIPFGFLPKNFAWIDFFPLLPWFGVFLIGISVGNLLYTDAKRRYSIKDLSSNIFVKPMSFLGRNSLVIYFIHQPVLLSLMYLIFFL